MTRPFAAPRARVYDAYTNPELVRRWLLGPPGWSMPLCEMDVRVGGERGEGGQSMVTGMTDGMEMSYALLDALLAEWGEG